MIEIRLKKKFGSFSIDVDFSAADQGITVLAGPSGSGKTSIINMIAGLVKPDSGRIFINGHVLFDSETGTDMPVNARKCGYVFQDGRLFPHMNVRKNLLYGCRDKNTSALAETCELLGIEHLLDRMPSKLSGGEKQRVSIGRALLMKPEILLMDEPLASLDQIRRKELVEYIDRIPEHFRIPVFYVTHSTQEIIRLSDSLIQIEKGSVISTGKVEGEYSETEDSDNGYVSIIECGLKNYNEKESLLEGEFSGGVFSVTSDERPSTDKFLIAVKSGNVSISLEEPKNISISNIFTGRIISLDEKTHGRITVHGDLNGTRLAADISKRSLIRLGLEQGQKIYFLIKAASIVR